MIVKSPYPNADDPRLRTWRYRFWHTVACIILGYGHSDERSWRLYWRCMDRALPASTTEEPRR